MTRVLSRRIPGVIFLVIRKRSARDFERQRVFRECFLAGLPASTNPVRAYPGARLTISSLFLRVDRDGK
jgi:hypothetical protein